ncbi:MAG: sulfurtransferase TusA family protein [Nitrospirae bacterium]|nr:sulfurtransferase TusA family protein [Nitrospirota bacterium]
MSKEIRVDKILDVKGLSCPGPTVLTMKALEGMKKGKVLQVMANDSSTRLAIPSLCRNTGYELLEFREDEGTLHFFIKR